MKAITEAILREELKATEPKVYYIPEGKILSPAAREYLNQRQIDIDFERNRSTREKAESQGDGGANLKKENSLNKAKDGEESSAPKAKYTDYETGASYFEKPEQMTQLFGNKLVDKNHPRIKYRGKLDRVQAEIVHAQVMISREENMGDEIIKDLDDILDTMRQLMRCEVLDEPFTKETILGLNHAELREQSHFPMKYFKIKQMLLPEHTMGLPHSMLNLIRTAIRETEVIAVDAFKEKRKLERTDIIEELNRLSSALHIMMCKYLAGDYNKK